MIHHIKRATRHLIFWSLVTIAIGLTGVRLVLSGIDAYKVSLAGQISEIIGAPVTIGRLGAKMRRFSPELILKDIAFASVAAEQPVVALKEIRLGVNLLDMLVHRELLPSAWVTLVGAKLSVQRKDDGSFAIVGLKAGDGQPLWLFEGSKFEVLQSEISWQDELGKKAPLKFTSVDIAIINVAGRHRINMLAKLPKQYGDTLTLSADFSGNPFAASALDGVVFIDGKNLQLSRWPAADLPLAMIIQSGAGDLKIWSRLQHSQPVSVNAEAWLQDVKLLRQDKGVFAVKSLNTGFHWRLDEGVDDSKHWRLDVRRFSLQTAELPNIIKQWPDAVFSLSGRGNDESMLQQIALSIVQIDLQEISRIALFFAPIPGDTAVALAQANISGSLKPFTLFADLHEKTIAVDGRFTGLGYAPFLTMPGIQNLSGRINGSDKQGVVHFSTQEARVASPELFREALVIKSLDGAIHWLQQDDKWRLSSSRINLDLLGLQSESRLRVNLPKNHGRPFVDMQMDLVCDDVSQLKHYFPTGVMRPVDTIWLDRAFVSGRVEKGRLSYYGELGPLAVLMHNPFPQAAKAQAASRPDIPPGMEGIYRVLSTETTGGLFEALLDVRQLELDYAPGWPRINDIAGELLFLQDRMEINAYQGYSNKLKAGKTIVINEAIGKSNKLGVQGEVEGEIADALGFLQQTPLNSRVGGLIDAIVPQGHTRIALDLLIPLNKEVEPKVDGSAELNKAGLTVKAVDLAISNIDGLLKFNEQGIYSDTIHAAAFKRPIRIDVDNADNETLIYVSGSAEVGDIEKQFELPDWDIADGTMNYRLKLSLPDEHLGSRSSGEVAGKAPELAVDSNLAGVAVRLPGALAKTRAEAKPLSMVFSLGEKALLPIAIRYDDKLKAAIRFDTVKQRIDSGHVLLGKGEAVQSADAGLKLEINRDPLDLKD